MAVESVYDGLVLVAPEKCCAHSVHQCVCPSTDHTKHTHTPLTQATGAQLAHDCSETKTKTKAKARAP